LIAHNQLIVPEIDTHAGEYGFQGQCPFDYLGLFLVLPIRLSDNHGPLDIDLAFTP
jgi:hypothetical protein